MTSTHAPTRILRTFLIIALAAITLVAVAADALRTSSTDALGTFLVDDEGMSVYLFLPDEEAGASTCTGDCAQAWPPVRPPEGFMDELEMGPDVNADLVGSIQRDDGTNQVTYNGWPLYYFAQDAEPGDTSGQGVGGNWYLVSVEGTAVGAGDTSASGEEEAIPLETLMAEGEAVYASTCSSCHGADGDESNGSHVAVIVESERTVENTGSFLRRVLFGGSYMPAFADILTDREVAAVTTYVRNSWGFDLPPVSVEEVVEQRERFQ